MYATYLPASQALLFWGSPVARGALGDLLLGRRVVRCELIGPAGRAQPVTGQAVGVVEAVSWLAAQPLATLHELTPAVAAWGFAAKLAVDLLVRQCAVPGLARRGGAAEARWRVVLGGEDLARVTALARAMPPAAHAVPADDHGVWSAEALLAEFLDDYVDTAIRAAAIETSAARKGAAWERRWVGALTSADAELATTGFTERTLADELERWSEPARGAHDRLRACFRLEPPTSGDRFTLRFLLQAPDDPSLLVEAREVWGRDARALGRLGRAFRDPQDSLLAALGRAARLFAPIERALDEARPEAVLLDPAEAWAFLQAAATVDAAGFGVIVPGELTAGGARRLKLRLRLGGGAPAAGRVQVESHVAFEQLVAFDWQAAIGDEPLTARDLAALAAQKAPLVELRGAWVAVDPRELEEIRRRLASGRGKMPLREALAAGLGGKLSTGGLVAEVVTGGAFAAALDRLRGGATAADLEPPRGLRGTLRGYQARGVAWLDTMAGLGLGACLADDMGLGKTIQMIAYLLRRPSKRPSLLVAPTSVVGNWERELGRFAPGLAISHHWGPDRARRPKDLRGGLIVTTYGLLRRDATLLGEVDWATLILDEAQNIKNAASTTARAARAIRADHRFALTGTPVENRLAELWSISEVLNPGLLGPLASFRTQYAVPIERYGSDEAASRLRAVIGPFLLRREKRDPAIAPELPAKHEMEVVCTLTREQATLYQAAVGAQLADIASARGIERRGKVLALLTHLKQICNHPAHYLGERGPLPRRSGKLARLEEMLDEVVAAGDRALVFTQYREMGELLVRSLEARLGREILYLHGGTSRAARDTMVARFQGATEAPVFVLSLKAGGTGINLTAATHVFHFDRWWNPAVEDQATDRAYRIGQSRAVQVHKLLCAGTVEEKIARMVADKRDLASKVISAGERWITELGDRDLRELFALGGDAVIDGADDDEPAPRRGRPRPEVRS